MRIGLDARYVGDHFPGIARYIVGLTNGLTQVRHPHTLVVIRRADADAAGDRYGMQALLQQPGIETVYAASGPFSPRQQYEIPQLLHRLRIDLYHAPYFIRPLINLPCPSVVTIYDLLGRRYPHALSLRGRLLYRVLMARSLRQADRLIAISQHCRSELAALYGLDPNRIAVSLLAADTHFRPQSAAIISEIRQRYGLAERYLLYVGSNKPHKNLARLLRAWALVVGGGRSADCELVLAGHEDPHYPQIRELAAASGLARSIRFLPNVADADLPGLYSGALGFVFPSLYEGFGLPPLEAMACGTPVIAARSSSLPEVVGDAAILVDPLSISALALAIGRLFEEPQLGEELRRRGLQRAAAFDWERTAIDTLAVYEGMLSRR